MNAFHVIGLAQDLTTRKVERDVEGEAGPDSRPLRTPKKEMDARLTTNAFCSRRNLNTELGEIDGQDDTSSLEPCTNTQSYV